MLMTDKRSKHEPQFRHLPLDRTAVNAEERTVAIAFSSEEPVERWFGTEVLDHTAKSVRMGRLNNGGALLFNHDPDQHVGVVEMAKIDSDRVGRAVVRFGNGALAQEKFRDVLDGILRHVSVGYVVHKFETVKRGGREVELGTDWEPLEISFVPVPADDTVGVGRSEERNEVIERLTAEKESIAAELAQERETTARLTKDVEAARAITVVLESEVAAAVVERDTSRAALQEAARQQAEFIARMLPELENSSGATQRLVAEFRRRQRMMAITA